MSVDPSRWPPPPRPDQDPGTLIRDVDAFMCGVLVGIAFCVLTFSFYVVTKAVGWW